MLDMGYVIFAIHDDPIDPEKSIMTVRQDISRLGTHPAFWDVLDRFGLDGAYGTKHAHQIKKKLPTGIYLTFA